MKNPPDWFGDQSTILVAPLNLWAAMIAASWRHVGYVMILYLAGLKSVDPALRDAAKVDGASERQTFTGVVFPAMAPINVVVVVITTIEALRAFDIVYIINRGRNGLELLSTLIYNNSIGEIEPGGFRFRHRRRPARGVAGPDHRLPGPDHAARLAMTPATVGVRQGPAVATRPRRRRLTRQRILLHGFLAFMALTWLFPLGWAIYAALRPYADTQLHGYISMPSELTLRQLHQRVHAR